jgi:hypothetical protein
VVGRRVLERERVPVAAELALVRVAVQAPVLVQGVAELEHARAEAELERGPVAAEPELDLVVERELVRAVAELALVRVAAPVPNLRPDQLEARRKTRSAIAAHPRGLVPLLAGAEDLAAVVVETTHDPAAAEVGTAWEAAATAVAVAPE